MALRKYTTHKGHRRTPETPRMHEQKSIGLDLNMASMTFASSLQPSAGSAAASRRPMSVGKAVVLSDGRRCSTLCQQALARGGAVCGNVDNSI